MAEFKVFKAEASRRDVIKGALKGAAYAAPIVAASAVPMVARAVTGPFGQSLFVNGANTTSVAIGSFLTFTGRGYISNGQVFLQILSLRTGAAIVTGANADGNGTLSVVVPTGGFPLGAFVATTYYNDPRTSNAAPLVSLTFTVTGGTTPVEGRNPNDFDPIPPGFERVAFPNI